MDKSIFELRRMDCAAEENLVRLRLGDMDAVKSLTFDLSARQVTIFHEGYLDFIRHAVEELDLDARLIDSRLASEHPAQDTQDQRTLLWTVLIINFAFFAIEALFGVIADSMGLVADSLDMLADSVVYGLSLYAVGSAKAGKKSLATISGYFQLSLAVIGLLEVLRRFFGQGLLPDFRTMIYVSGLALIANAFSLYLLQRSGSQEVHMRASMIFTSNDVIVNIGVIAAGLLVNWLNNGIPDLLIGAIVFVIVSRGAFRILKLGSSP
ncbi:MAG TPA: cation transporter [Anaerolineales bacterium]|nr:cation transporter [Anaerolineales bacterium]HUS84516.1 cation transporter [Anaerolineales bacterium]